MIPLADMLMFFTFAYLGFRNRTHPAVHKRLMLFATFALLDAGFDRWSIFDPYPLPGSVHVVCFLPLLAVLMAYDWWSTGKLQRVTLWASCFLVAVQQLRHPLSHTASGRPSLRGPKLTQSLFANSHAKGANESSVRPTPGSMAPEIDVVPSASSAIRKLSGFHGRD